MGKKQDVEYRDPTCQNCESHGNKPSFCGKHNKFVNRKADICLDYSGPQQVVKYIPKEEN